MKHMMKVSWKSGEETSALSRRLSLLLLRCGDLAVFMVESYLEEDLTLVIEITPLLAIPTLARGIAALKQ